MNRLKRTAPAMVTNGHDARLRDTRALHAPRQKAVTA